MVDPKSFHQRISPDDTLAPSVLHRTVSTPATSNLCRCRNFAFGCRSLDKGDEALEAGMDGPMGASLYAEHRRIGSSERGFGEWILEESVLGFDFGGDREIPRWRLGAVSIDLHDGVALYGRKVAHREALARWQSTTEKSCATVCDAPGNRGWNQRNRFSYR